DVARRGAGGTRAGGGGHGQGSAGPRGGGAGGPDGAGGAPRLLPVFPAEHGLLLPAQGRTTGESPRPRGVPELPAAGVPVRPGRRLGERAGAGLAGLLPFAGPAPRRVLEL